MRASNAIYDVPEGRPIWKTVPTRLAVTIATGVLLVISAFIVVFTGGVARARRRPRRARQGRGAGLGHPEVAGAGRPGQPDVRDPVLGVTERQARRLPLGLPRWRRSRCSSGSWSSAAFAFYLANFANYNKTYGALGGVIAFLVWLWISNIAVLLGAEFDAELERGRAIKAGHPEDEEPFVELRDTRKVKKGRDQDLR